MSSPCRLVVILFFAVADILAQIKLPDVIRHGGDAIKQLPGRVPQQPAGQQEQTKNGGIAYPPFPPSQCHDLAQWISILQQQDPGVDFLHTAMGPKLMDQVLNLYRDEFFQPLYGRSFSQTTAQERLAFHRDVLRRCAQSTGQMTAAEQSMLRQYENLVNRPFIFKGAADFSGDYVIAGLAQRQTLLAWIQQVTQGLAQVPPTPQGFEELQSDIKRGQTDLDKLWPREKQAFLKAVTDRQSVLARAILDTTSTTANAEAAKGFEGVKAITTLYSGQDRYLQLLDPESKAQVQKQKEQAIAAAVQAAMPAEKQKLAAIATPGLEGAAGVAVWERTFKTQTQGLPALPETRSLIADAEQKRKKLLTAGLPEFKTLVALHPKPGRNGIDAAATVAKLFPDPADTSLPEYQQFQSLLSARLEAVAKAKAKEDEAATKKAAEEEAKALARKYPGTGIGQKTSCDTAAAHPLDKGRAVGVLGVSDDKIVAKEAITACLQAVKSAPKTGRFQFQLGRAYWAAEQYDEALDAMLKAEALDYAPAYFYLGMAYEDGLADEKGEPDLETARDMYMVAAAEGFEPAVAAYQDFEEVDEAEVTLFSELKKPDLMRALMDGNIDGVVRDATTALYYIAGIQGLVTDHDELLKEMSAKCQALADSRVSADLMAAIYHEAQKRVLSAMTSGGGPGRVLEGLAGDLSENGIKRDLEEIGEDDMFFVVGLSGGCESPAIQKLYNNVKAALPRVIAATR